MQMDHSEKDNSGTVGQVIRNAFKELGETLAAFVRAPRALWGVNVPYILEGLAYFGILTILGKYCSENVALTDPQAGWVYGGVTGGITFAMLLLGGVVDKIGVRLSLALALGTMAVGRLIISFSGTLTLGAGLGSPMFFTMAAGLLLMVVAYGLYQPAAYAGVKRYTNPQTAAMGYAVLYALMNLGAFIAGYIANFSRTTCETIFPPNGLTAVFWSFTIITVLSVFTTLILLTKKVDSRAIIKIKAETAGMQSGARQDDKTPTSQTAAKENINNTLLWIFAAVAIASLVFMIRDFASAAQRPLTMRVGAAVFFAFCLAFTLWEFLRRRPDHPFRDSRFMAFIFILIPVQTLFAHNWLTIPYYLDRAFRGNWVGNYWEILSNINPIIIFVLTPIIAGLTARANVYRMMIIGTMVMAAPTFLLAVGPVPGLFILYIIIMSVGEAMWQPRFLQWVAEIAPEGQTGAYMGIGQFPWFLTKVVTSLYSGYFVAHYIPRPESGLAQQSGRMWLFYGIIAMISPLVLWIMKGWMVKGMRQKSGA
jgi:proton-dependent oligopeptide transporter, POT family